MEIVSHRLRTKAGQFGNSRENLIALYYMGITWVEADICLGPGGEILVHHPGKVKPNIDVMTLQKLLCIISSLPNMHLILEIKENSKELVERAVFLITELKLQDRIYLTSFQVKIRIPFIAKMETDGELLLLAKRLNPNIKTHLIANWPSNLPKTAEQYHPDMISFGWLQEPGTVRVVSRFLFKILVKTRFFRDDIKEVKKKGIKVMAGIVNTAKDMEYFRNLGIDRIMTDEPKILMDLIRNQKRK